MSKLRIRGATPEDHAAFVRLFLELGTDDVPADRDRFMAEVAPTTLFAEQDGEIAGYAHWRTLGEAAHLGHLVTAPGARRRGVGRALLAETIASVKASGCTSITLNVRLANVPAIALYESFGLRTIFTSRALRLAWSVLDGMTTPFPAQATKEIAPSDDGRLEKAFELLPGTLADARRKVGRSLFALETDRGRALAVFDRFFPGAYPFHATDCGHALSILRALRTWARPEDATISLAMEQQAALATELIAAGAVLRFEMLRMSGAI